MVAVVLTALGPGALTSVGQSVLPAAVNSFANSASGWTFLTALLVWTVRRGTGLSAALGAAAFIALTVGYAVVSTARGFFDDTLPWSVIGLVVGPFVGVAATWLHTSRTRLALGSGLLAGIGVGNSDYGLTAISATTSPVYWVIAAVVSVALTLAAAIRLHSIRRVLLEVATLVVVAVSMRIAYGIL